MCDNKMILSIVSKKKYIYINITVRLLFDMDVYWKVAALYTWWTENR